LSGRSKNGWGLGDAWKPFDVRGPIKPHGWTPKRIPLLDADGVHIMHDLDPAEDGSNGQVIDHSHEIGPKSLLAARWLAWLNHLADDLEVANAAAEETVAPRGMYD
jgi:cell wall assembly regulator SMI1